MNYGQRLKRALVLTGVICGFALAAPAIPAHMPAIPLVSTAITAVAPASTDAHIARSAASGAGHAYSYHVRYAMNNTPSIGVYPSSRPLQTQLFLSSGSWHYLEQWRLWHKGTGKSAGTCWMHAYLYGRYNDVHISKFQNGSPCPYPSRLNKATYFPLTGVFRWGWL